jgi:hypothetical protein
MVKNKERIDKMRLKIVLIIVMLLFTSKIANAGIIDWMQRSAINKHLANLEEKADNNQKFKPVEGKRYILLNIVIRNNRTEYNWIDKETGEAEMWFRVNYMPQETPEYVKEMFRDVYGGKL